MVADGGLNVLLRMVVHWAAVCEVGWWCFQWFEAQGLQIEWQTDMSVAVNMGRIRPAVLSALVAVDLVTTVLV